MSTFGAAQTCPDDSFGPWAGPACRGAFDFTLLFEETILSILLSALFIPAAIVRLIWLIRQPVKVQSSALGWAKTIAPLCLAALSLALVALWATTDNTNRIIRTRASVPSATLALVASLLYAFLSSLDHRRTVRPAWLLSVYLGLSILLDLPRVRTLWMIDGTRPVAGVFTASFAIRIGLLCLETVEKGSLLLEEHQHATQESRAGPFNRATFGWMNPLFFKGYRNVLSLPDMYKMDDDLDTDLLRNTMAEAWAKVPDKKTPGILFSTWMSTFIGPFLIPVFPRLCQIGFTYAQPFLITATIGVAVTPKGQPFDNYGYGLIGAFFLVFVGNAIAVGRYEWRNYRFAVMMRGSLVSLIYDKALTLDSFAETTEFSPSSTLTLASTDVETIYNGLIQMHEVWSNLIEIAIAIYLLERQLGVACVMTVSLSLAVLIGTGILAIPTGSRQADWNNASQKRVTTTSSVLSSIKWIKVSGLTDACFNVVSHLRVRELAISERFRLFIGIALLLSLCTPLCGPFLTFATYAGLAKGSDSSLNLSKVFTSYSIMILLGSPLTKLVGALPSVAGTVTSFQRIQDYLSAVERTDVRHLEHGAAIQDGSINKRGSDGTFVDSSAQDTVREKDAEVQALPTTSPDSDNLFSISGKLYAPTVPVDETKADAEGKSSKEKNDKSNNDKSNIDQTEPVAEQLILNIDKPLHFPRHALSLILGPVGCGKSTLLKALLGELSEFRGTIGSVDLATVAYCDQTPWLQNETIRRIITGVSDNDQTTTKQATGIDADENWYRAVIKACELEQDVAIWPEGDQTIAGSKGISLSGGQKQRIAIARAVYSRRQVFILDDVFSALDASTEDLVFENLLGRNGLLRKANTTVILASSSAARVSYADNLIILDRNGQVDQCGNPQEVLAVVPDLKAVLVTRRDSKEAITSQNEDNVAAAAATTATVAPELLGIKDQQGGITITDSAVQQHLLTDHSADAARQAGDSAVYKFYATAAGWPSIVIFALAMAVFAFCDAFPSIWLKWWAEADVKAEHAGSNLGKWLGVYSILVAGAIASCFVAMWKLFITIINDSGLFFHKGLVEKVSQAPLGFFTTTDIGVTINRFSQDLQLIDMELPPAVLLATMSGAFGVAQIVLVSASSKYMAIFLPFLFLAFYLLGHFYLRTARQLRLLDIEHKAPLYSQIIDTISGIVTIRAFGWQARSAEKNQRLLRDSQRPYYLLFCAQRWLTFAVNMMITVFAILLVTFSTQLREQIGPGYIGVALSNILAFNFTAQAVIESWVQLEVSLGAVARIRAFTASMESEDDQVSRQLKELKPEKQMKTIGSEDLALLDKSWPARGQIDFEQLCASYPSSGSVLHNVSLSIQPGQKVAFCGRTGSGKSSLFLSLLGLIVQDSGAILIDGEDLATLPREFIRQGLVSVPQETFIFEGSVRFNIDPRGNNPESQSSNDKNTNPSVDEENAKKPERDQEIIKVLKQVGLWDKVEAIGGLDAILHEKMLSHGQVQLLALARALMRREHGRVLLLDEVTSSLDTTTRTLMDTVIREEFKDWTTLVIAHELDAVLDLDRVAVLDAGKLVEFGEPRALLEKDDSWFRSLYLLSTKASGTGVAA